MFLIICAYSCTTDRIWTATYFFPLVKELTLGSMYIVTVYIHVHCVHTKAAFTGVLTDTLPLTGKKFPHLEKEVI